MIPALLLLLALPADAQKMTGSAFCICPGGKRGHIQSPMTCESFCGDGSQRGFHAPQHDPYEQQRRDQEAAERARRVREDAERAARAERERLEKERRFQADKREALGQLKGVTAAEPQLKGVGGDSGGLKGLKGIDGAGQGLKGLATKKDGPGGRAPGAAGHEGRTCRVAENCRAALAEQASSMEAARTEQADLYMAAGTADFNHGLDLAQEAVKDGGAKGRVAVYVWKTQDRFGVPQYAEDYKTAVDEAAELVDEETLDAGTKGIGSKAKKTKKTVESLLAFHRYMQALLACGNGPDEDFDRCATQAAKDFGTALDGLPIAEASKARVKAAAEAFTKHSTNALKRAKRAADAASRCLSACP